MNPVGKTIGCMKWGTRYGPEYVNRLFASITRNITPPFRFLCFTDDDTNLVEGIEIHPLPSITLPEAVAWTPWRKLCVWQKPLAGITQGDILFLDVDLVITGSLDDFFSYKPGEYCVIENWTQKGQHIGNTSVFRVPIGRYTEIFSRFDNHPDAILRAHRIEQQYISAHIPEQKFWPSSWCRSFKHELLPRFPFNWWQEASLPKDARIVAFTGHPDPDEARDGKWPAPFYKKHYKHVRPVPWIVEHWR